MTNSDQPGAQDGARFTSSPEPWVYRALKFIMALILFSMAGLTFVDVVGRYVFSYPIPGTFESVGLLMGIVTFTALPLVTRARNHITVDLFDSFIKGKVRKVQQFMILVGSAAVMGLFSERLIATAIDEYQNDYVTEYFGITRAPLIIALALLCMITCGILLIMIRMYLNGTLEEKAVDSDLTAIEPSDKPTH